MKKIYYVLKKIILAFLVIYSYNLIVPAKWMISLNLFSLLSVILFGIGGLFILIVINLLIF